MSKSTIRKDKTCLNCRHVVDLRYCPNCGQENTDTRKTFHHLFVHFFEDLTHYENAFWKTIKNLLFKPASLTKEYLSGKRLSYLAPVRLYIFISFVTFFIMAVSPNREEKAINMKQSRTFTQSGKGGKTDTIFTNKKVKISDLIKAEEAKAKKANLSYEDQNKDFLNFGYKSLKELDSLQKFGPKDEKLEDWQYNIMKKVLIVKSKHTKSEMLEKFVEASWRNIPKALFIYMPIFALILWLFHGKKRWYYFDHGIFTLHYFSFLLLCTLLRFFVTKLMNCFGDNFIANGIEGVINFVGMLWMFYYFFPAHHRFYGESRIISLLKSVFIFLINMILLLILMIVFIVYTFINIH